MSEGPDLTLPAEIESMSLTVEVGCTVAVNGTDWVKPSAAATMKWKGIPNEEQFIIAKTFMQANIIAPTINEALELAVRRVHDHVAEVQKMEKGTG